MSDVILSIEPRLPPAVCGTSTYGWELARHWPDRAKRFVHLVVDGAAESQQHYGYSDIFAVGESSRGLAAQMAQYPGAGVILHHASRGFNRHGCPLWLARGITRWRRRNPDAPLLVFFHEVPRRLPITSHHFLIEWINWGVLRRLVRAASAVATNAADHAQRLTQITGIAEVPQIPVPSNIPLASAAPASFQERRSGEFLIFGVALTRLLTIKAFRDEIAAWKRAGVLEKLHLVGPDDGKFAAPLNELLKETLPAEMIVRHGELPPTEISRLLSRVGFCLSQSNEQNFSKSGTFAAFAAHGCPLIMRSGDRRAEAPFRHLIQPGELLAGGSKVAFSTFEKRAHDLREWYAREVDWPNLAKKLSYLFARSVPGSGR